MWIRPRTTLMRLMNQTWTPVVTSTWSLATLTQLNMATTMTLSWILVRVTRQATSVRRVFPIERIIHGVITRITVPGPIKHGVMTTRKGLLTKNN